MASANDAIALLMFGNKMTREEVNALDLSAVVEIESKVYAFRVKFVDRGDPAAHGNISSFLGAINNAARENFFQLGAAAQGFED